MPLPPNEALPGQYHHRVFGGQGRESGRQGRKLTPMPLACENCDTDDGSQQHRCRPVLVRQEACMLMWLSVPARVCFLLHHLNFQFKRRLAEVVMNL